LATVSALWTGSPAPPEYTDLILMRDVFHCTPSALYEQDAEDIAVVLTLLDAEATVRRMQNRSGGRAGPVEGDDG